MRRFLIRLTIALVAFIVGVTAASIFGGLFGPRAQHRCVGVGLDTYVATPPMPAEHHSCPMHRFDIPAPPAAPEPPKFEKSMRVRVRAADGTVKEVEIKTEKDAEQ
ncbi:MAG: hypothetical protein DMF67_05235 [Acidobacteria bacterium]|nr:MAG: hypothetical protein DMF67_05235 [Acidobacteriota bacterium]